MTEEWPERAAQHKAVPFSWYGNPDLSSKFAPWWMRIWSTQQSGYFCSHRTSNTLILVGNGQVVFRILQAQIISTGNLPLRQTNGRSGTQSSMELHPRTIFLQYLLQMRWVSTICKENDEIAFAANIIGFQIWMHLESHAVITFTIDGWPLLQAIINGVKPLALASIFASEVMSL